MNPTPPTPEASPPQPKSLPVRVEAVLPPGVPWLPRRDSLVLLGVLVLFAVVFRDALCAGPRWHNVDEGLWTGLAAFYTTSDISFAEILIHGGDRPFHMGIYALCDRWFGHYNLVALGIAHSILIGVTAWGLALLGNALLRLRSPWALLALGAVYVLHSYTIYEGEVGNSEHAANLFLIGFLALWVRGWRRDSEWLRYTAFLLLGCAFQTKKQLAPLVLCAPAFWALCLRQRSATRGLRGFLHEMVGSAVFFLLPWLAVLLTISWGRPEGVLSANYVEYVISNRAPPEGRLVKAYTRLHVHVANVLVMFAAAVSSLSVFVAAPRDEAQRAQLLPLKLLAVPFLLCLLATIPGFHLFSHYFLFALPISVVICAALAQLALARRVCAPRTLVAAAVSAFVVLGPPHWRSLQRRDNPRDLLVAQWIQQQVEPDQRILVWGWAPHLYLFSERIPATRHVSISYLANDYELEDVPDYDAVHMQTLLADLERYPPELIVVPEHQDWAFDGSRYALERFPPVVALIERDYVPFATAYEHRIFKRKR